MKVISGGPRKDREDSGGNKSGVSLGTVLTTYGFGFIHSLKILSFLSHNIRKFNLTSITFF